MPALACVCVCVRASVEAVWCTSTQVAGIQSIQSPLQEGDCGDAQVRPFAQAMHKSHRKPLPQQAGGRTCDIDAGHRGPDLAARCANVGILGAKVAADGAVGSNLTPAIILHHSKPATSASRSRPDAAGVASNPFRAVESLHRLAPTPLRKAHSYVHNSVCRCCCMARVCCSRWLLICL